MPESTGEARLFVAIPVAPETRAELAALGRNLQKGFQFTPCRPAWADPETMHLTLAFLGRKPRAVVAPLEDALRKAASEFSPLRFEVKGLGVFPNWRRPSVLWVGMRERTHQLLPLHEAVERVLSRFDYEPDPREFHPHLTLARFPNLRGVDAAHSIVEAHRSFRAEAFEARECILYESELLSSDARHIALKSFSFSREAPHAQSQPS